jgi:isopentenyl-diphosphate delta-isomerase
MLRITSLKGAVDRLVADGRQPDGAALRTVARKSDHLRINLQEDVAAKGVSSGFDRYRFLHRALPEIDLAAVGTRTTLFGRELGAPILISCMTGGTQEAQRINTTLARVAQDLGLAVGLGSGRVLLENPEVLPTFDMRRHAPDVALFANLGAVQLNKGVTVEDALRLVEMLGADALVLHLNPLQEALQPGGDTCFAGLLPKIATLCRRLQKPVVVKEVGWGLAPDVVRGLVDAGAVGVDVAGAGGTSWSEVERHRLGEPWRARAAAAFAGWGLPTADALRQARAAAPDALVFASGGVKDGIDVAKAVALGADLVGLAGPFLRAADSGFETARDLARELTETLRISMFCVGARSLAELTGTPRLVGVNGAEPRVHTETLTFATEAAGQFIDLTEDVRRVVASSGVVEGQVHVYSNHTTAAIRINENEPLLMADFRRLLERLVPSGDYDHDDMSRRQGVLPGEPRNGHAHCQHLMLSSSETLPVTGGRPGLGTWQSVFLIELCSSRTRRVTVQVTGR